MLLRALNVSHVDFFSLDVEKVEEDVLKHFPFDEITVDVWAIEHRVRGYTDKTPPPHPNVSLAKMKKNSLFTRIEILTRESSLSNIEDTLFIKFMLSKGYYLLDILCTHVPDYIFVRKNSDLYKRLHVPSFAENRTSVCEEKGFITSMDSFPVDFLRDSHHYPNLIYHTPER